MTARQRLARVCLFLATLTYYQGAYLWINSWSARRGVSHELLLPGEAAIPFVPFFLTGYLAIYGVIIYLYLHIRDPHLFKRAIAAFWICLTIHFITFLVFPVQCVLRPSIDPSASWLLRLIDFYFWWDLPYNCFPSIHVSVALLALFLLACSEGEVRFSKILFALFICSSVVFVKQHYVLDVVAAIPVAVLSYWLAVLATPAPARVPVPAAQESHSGAVPEPLQ